MIRCRFVSSAPETFSLARALLHGAPGTTRTLIWPLASCWGGHVHTCHRRNVQPMTPLFRIRVIRRVCGAFQISSLTLRRRLERRCRDARVNGYAAGGPALRSWPSECRTRYWGPLSWPLFKRSFGVAPSLTNCLMPGTLYRNGVGMWLKKPWRHFGFFNPILGIIHQKK